MNPESKVRGETSFTAIICPNCKSQKVRRANRKEKISGVTHVCRRCDASLKVA